MPSGPGRPNTRFCRVFSRTKKSTPLKNINNRHAHTPHTPQSVRLGQGFSALCRTVPSDASFLSYWCGQVHTVLSCGPTSRWTPPSPSARSTGGTVPRNDQHGAQRRRSRRTGGGDQPHESDEVIRRCVGVVRPACGFWPSQLVAGLSGQGPPKRYPRHGRQPPRRGELRARDEPAWGFDGCAMHGRCTGGIAACLYDVVVCFLYFSATSTPHLLRGPPTR